MAGLDVNLEPWGPDQASLDSASQVTLQHPSVRAHLDGTRHRLISCELVDADDKSEVLSPPSRYRATVFDYTNNRAVIAQASLAEPQVVEVAVSNSQPVPSFEEFEAALSILSTDPQLGGALNDGRLRAYRPMPPVIADTTERLLCVGLLPREAGSQVHHEIVGVNMLRDEVVRFDGNA
ncbi:MAG: hypothetical protein M3280_11995, partial [Actinomycetota bacterium]|nr:hypothetical protein [Actinomycetota bacterium]